MPPKRILALISALTLAAAASAQTPPTPARQMAATVLQQWPAGPANKNVYGYELGFLLDAIAAQWRLHPDPADLAYIKTTVDRYVTDDGTITGYKASGHTLDDIEMGRTILLLYTVTHEEKYAKAAHFLHDQLAVQPRTPSGGFWHKQTYPNQMWLDGAYMAEPFRAQYAVLFHTPTDFDDIAKQLLLMDTHMRDPANGLLHHGWDDTGAGEAKMAWADKTTGLSPEAWGRAMGWYCMALVEVLDSFPKGHPQRAALLAALRRTIAAVLKVQDPATGLWWQVLDRPNAPGNYFEASASCMFTYAIAKGVRMGYLPAADEATAHRAWAGIQKQFVTANPDGTLTLHGTVKVGGLGGTPYRAGDYAYYISEPVVDQDKKGVAAFILAGSELEQARLKSARH
jgi:unsaturated rhamnogalacturonyl hydrolase